MTQVQEFTRPTVRDLNKLLDEHLQEFAKKHGLKVAVRGSTFSQTSCTTKVEFMTEEGTGIKQERKEAALEIYAKAYLPGVDLDKTYNHPRLTTFKLVGWNTKAREYPVVVEAADGKRYKMSIADVKAFIKL